MKTLRLILRAIFKWIDGIPHDSDYSKKNRREPYDVFFDDPGAG